MARKNFLVWFLKDDKRHSLRGINAATPEAARAEAQRRIDQGGIIGCREHHGRLKSEFDFYIWGRPNAGITVWSVIEHGEPTELADRDVETERARKEGLEAPRPPGIPF